MRVKWVAIWQGKVELESPRTRLDRFFFHSFSKHVEGVGGVKREYQELEERREKG